MELAQILVLVVGNAAVIIPLFLWNRGEARADYRHMEAGISAMRELIAAMHAETHAEMKDFHGRLCAIEERKRSEEKKKK